MSRGTLHPFRLLDAPVIAACAAGALAFWPLFQSHRPSTAAIFRDDEKIAEYPLSESRTVQIRGDLGEMTISIGADGACVLRSTCPKQICAHAGTIRQTGQQIICAPNHVLIELESSSGRAVDAVAK
jgi:hypothetical protein